MTSIVYLRRPRSCSSSQDLFFRIFFFGFFGRDRDRAFRSEEPREKKKTTSYPCKGKARVVVDLGAEHTITAKNRRLIVFSSGRGVDFDRARDSGLGLFGVPTLKRVMT